jgi:hypothetical protein
MNRPVPFSRPSSWAHSSRAAAHRLRSAQRGHLSSGEAISATDYAYSSPRRARRLRRSPVNGARIACDPRTRALSESCAVSSVDLSPLEA